MLVLFFDCLALGQLPCQATYAKIIGTSVDKERGYSLALSKDRNHIYLGGFKNDNVVVLLFELNGKLVWTRVLETNGAEHLSAILVDSDDKIVIAGTSGSPDAGGEGFILRYDPSINTILWYNDVSLFDTSFTFGLLEKGDGGNYIISTNPQSPNDAVLLEFNRNNGSLNNNFSKRYDLGNAETVHSMVFYKNNIYAVGRYTNGAGFGNMRHALTKFEPSTGLPVWSRLTHKPPTDVARLYGTDLVVENDNIISIGSGDDNGTEITFGTNIFIQKNDLDGNLLWLKKIDLINWNNEFAEEIVSVSDGFVILARSFSPPSNIFLIKTSKNGDLIWAKSFDYVYNDNFTRVAAIQSQIISVDDFLFFTAIAENGDEDMIFLKTDAFGNIDNQCSSIKDLKVTITNVASPLNVTINLTYTNINPLVATNKSVFIKNTLIGDNTICQHSIESSLYLGPDVISCKDTALTIQASPNFKSYLWSNGSTMDFINIETPGIYWLTAIDNCDSIKTDSIIYKKLPDLVAYLPPTLKIPYGDNVKISPLTNRTIKFWRWEPDEGLDTNRADITVIASKNITYRLQVTDEHGCTTETSVSIVVILPDCIPKPYYIPNAFSPNSKFGNEFFTIISNGRCIKKIKLLNVYSRWGELVAHNDSHTYGDSNFGWNGFFNGKDAEPGVYTYYAEIELFDGTTERIKGDVTLIR